MKNNRIFTGVMAALPTLFDEDGVVNVEAVRRLVDYELAAGLKGFYVCGSTGEGAVLPAETRRRMCEAVIEANAGRGKVIVHTGAVNVKEAVELTRHATAAGADAISSVPPTAYFSYTREEIADYYKCLADNTNLPLLIYAVKFLGVDGLLEMMEDLLNTPNIIGLKDTRADYYGMWKMRQLNGGNINIINGPDEMLICGLTMGADGGIGSTYNVMPEWYAALYNAFQEGNLSLAREIQTKINRVITVLLALAKCSCIGTIKLALRLRGIEAGAMCAPARDFTPLETEAFKAEMEKAGYTFSPIP